MDSFLKQVKDNIDRFSMLEEDENVLVGLSGGADSVALLLSLYKLGYKVKACHLNHCLRGDEADRDEYFCKNLCDKLNIELVIKRENIAEYAKNSKQSIETAAREIRYKFFDDVSNGCKIATAHTASDTIETMIFHLARGTGLTGLCSIPPVRGKIIRPLISLTRAEIENFLQNINQDFVTDSTNLTDDYTRNKIRSQIIPVLKNINPQAEKAAVNLAFRLREEEDFLETTAKAELERAKTKDGFKVWVFNNTDKAIKHRMLKMLCKNVGVPMHEFNSKHILALESLLKNNNPSARISLPADFIAKREYENIKIERKINQNSQEVKEILLENLIDNGQNINDINIIIKKHKKNYLFYKTFNTFYVDCDTIDMQSCVLRKRQTGDKIRLSEKSGSKTLKKLLIEKKIPADKRDKLIVIADKNGVIAVQDVGIDISRKVADGEILEIKIKG